MSPTQMNVSVVIPTYNRAKFLREAIESALSQTLPPMGVYVVDDASTDETPQLMAQWYGANPKVHYLCLSENGGPAYARMVGVQAAQTEWIAFLDSDDVWAPNHLENASRIIAENPHVRLIYAQRSHINKDGEVILDRVIEDWSGNISDVLFKRIIFRPSQIIVSKEIYQQVASKIPIEMKDIYFVEDYIFGVFVAYFYHDKIYVSKECTVFMRIHDNQSYHQSDRLRNNLLKAVEIIFSTIKSLESYSALTKAVNLFHAAYFLWRAGAWGEAWKNFLAGFWVAPASLRLKDFWVTLSRLIWPPRARSLFRPGR